MAALSRHGRRLRARAEETVVGATVNIPLRPGTGEDEFLEAFRAQALPALRSFDPGLLLVSAGFDAHAADPLTDLGLGRRARSRP